MVKEMFPPPTSHCKGVELTHLFPENGGALMVRDSEASYDGWYWGWFGWGEGDWAPTWPATSAHGYPNTGFGLYCTNCHSSAQDQTFASLRNIKGEPGEPLTFLSQDFYLEDHFKVGTSGLGQRRGQPPPEVEFRTHHEDVATEESEVETATATFQRRLRTRKHYDPAFTEIFQLLSGAPAADGEAPDSALSDLRSCVDPGRQADRGVALRDVGPMYRLPQRGRHRPAIPHDRAGTSNEALEHVALRLVA